MELYLHFILLMARSHGFGSMATDLNALLTLGFPSTSVLNTLILPVTITRRTVLQKVRQHPLTGYDCL